MDEVLERMFEAFRVAVQWSDPFGDSVRELKASKTSETRGEITELGDFVEIRIIGRWDESGIFEVDRVSISAPDPAPGLPSVSNVI